MRWWLTLVARRKSEELFVLNLLLVTKGRKSGARHLFPLFYGEAGKGWFIIASKGGAPEHPGWYRNILANPEVEIQAAEYVLLRERDIHALAIQARSPEEL